MTVTPPEARQPLRPLLARIWRDYLSERKGRLALAMLCAAITAGTTALILRLLEPAVNGLFVDQDPNALWMIPAAIAGVGVIRGAAAIGQANLVNRLGHGVVGEIQSQLFARMIRADLARLRAQHSGGFVSSVLFDANLVREAFTTGTVSYTQHGLTLLALIASMIWIDPMLALVVLCGMPVVNLVLRRFSKKARKAAVGAMAETTVLSTALMENLDGVRLVKIENREDAEDARVGEVIARRQRFVIKGANAKAFSGPSSEMVAMFVVAAVLTYAGWRSQQGEMNVGEFTAFIGILLAAAQSLRNLSNLQTVLAEGLTAARRLFEALDIQPEIREAAEPVDLPDGPCEVRFEDVSFAYSDAAPTLSGVDIRVSPGETVALVGPSGGGKSTILSLLPRFYDVTGGAVRINGVDVRDVALKALRDRIALVTQEPFLFDETIAFNIAYSRPDASQAEVEAAARAAAAHEFITALPEGYDTRAGEAGVRLSGGQRQRIAIARAFLKDAPILLLDEATSALDTESEALVQAALERLMEGRATLMIAHRLSTVQNADRIYVIEAGRVVEEGSHTELVGRGGLYARLARQQSLDAAPDEAGS
ncbi:ABC transporter ATP-binding protein [Brevundimonas sp. BAL450]|jgi:ATP-binding cassette, subfamily B, bacterial MsbA|uniref:Lipid A export ATP-binding/permease protein MsbA n=1 Tax=Brevundimonas abyssalis TAR-001 TaxID=1391729 RepID=A0A8E0TSH9_9CAUL|nr:MULTISPECIES: ABC transporter ATP-binding protein [Brevundimonas]MBG7614106.1 ABC transporter ATP-binding protein [Brevundimonas sp. BAL450]GAD59336.1 lipid A export ATP-binding/permease protein MsbA [Brevundimonas abyssalis TAR-001]